MSRNENRMPRPGGPTFITDGGLETTLIFQEGIDLPDFAAFVLLESAQGRQQLGDYYRPYAELAVETGCGFIYESPTWRANPDWGKRLGYDAARLDAANRQAIDLMARVRDGVGAEQATIISGCIGPRGDGYVAGEKMTTQEAAAYHDAQVASFQEAGADMICGLTMTYPEEATGIVLAARARGIPAVISFTTETDGRLPDGSGLRESIEAVDRASDGGPAYYMLNCAHPDHFRGALEAGEAWAQRIGGIRANASRMSHEELDQAEELDAGDPVELGQIYGEFRSNFPGLSVLGGCCGTDHRHVSHMCRSS